MNLYTNVAHAMRDRGDTLEVSLLNVEVDSHFAALYPDMHPGPYLKLAVIDTGYVDTA
jgi:hypothetical protein